ncbi:MAG TPA: hypothetical protein VHJ40_08355, partial [Actinomycetota bacterium]|nr:hypothetical protein [Actinomycetota bacterium]
MSTNSEALATELTIKVRRPRVAVSALLWSGIMLSALLSLTYTHSFANYGRPDARLEDQHEGDALIRTNGDPSHRKDDEDRDDEVEDDEDDEGGG